MNSVFLHGRLGEQPELKTTPGGKSVTNFRLATDDGKEHTEWHNIVCWEKTAELVAQYLNKGSEAIIEGRIQTREWEDKQGAKRWTTEVVAHRVNFCGPKPETMGSPDNSRRPPVDDSSIPF